jgi:hypothetical protein
MEMPTAFLVTERRIVRRKMEITWLMSPARRNAFIVVIASAAVV